MYRYPHTLDQDLTSHTTSHTMFEFSPPFDVDHLKPLLSGMVPILQSPYSRGHRPEVSPINAINCN